MSGQPFIRCMYAINIKTCPCLKIVTTPRFSITRSIFALDKLLLQGGHTVHYTSYCKNCSSSFIIPNQATLDQRENTATCHLRQGKAYFGGDSLGNKPVAILETDLSNGAKHRMR